MKRWSGALLTAILVVVVGGPLPAHAAGCAPGTGVTVVVDFGSLGEGAQVACVPDGAGRAGSSVVEDAGFDLRYVVNSGFVCRIDDKPASDPCQRTPPANAYWGLFESDGTQGWTYSTVGLGALEVPAGGSIGFRWQDSTSTKQPGVPPNQNPQPTAAPTTPKPSAKPTRQPSTKPAVKPTAPTTPPPSVNASTTPTHTPTPTPTPTSTPTPTPTPSPVEATTSAAPVHTPSQTPTPTLSAQPEQPVVPVAEETTDLVPYAAGAMALLLGALAFLAWRRRG